MKPGTWISETVRAVRCSHQQCRVVTEITNMFVNARSAFNVIVDGRFLLFFLFCKVRPARAVERSTSAAASLLAGCRWIAFDTAVQSTGALQKSGFPPVFVYSYVFKSWILNLGSWNALCAFVSLCLCVPLIKKVIVNVIVIVKLKIVWNSHS